MCEKDRFYMSIAIEEGKKAYSKGEVPIGAVLVIDGEVVSKAHNLREITQKTTSHAEIIAIEKANESVGFWRLENATLYVTTEPCVMCAGAILQARIKRLVYGTKDEKAGCVGSLYNLLDDNRFNHQVEIEEGVLKEECQKLLKDFFKDLRKSKFRFKR